MLSIRRRCTRLPSLMYLIRRVTFNQIYLLMTAVPAESSEGDSAHAFNSTEVYTSSKLTYLIRRDRNNLSYLLMTAVPAESSEGDSAHAFNSTQVYTSSKLDLLNTPSPFQETRLRQNFLNQSSPRHTIL